MSPGPARHLLVTVVALMAISAGGAGTALGAPSSPAVVRGDGWYLRDELSSGYADLTFEYAMPGDLPIMGDWDGNGSETPGVFRDGRFILSNEYDDTNVFVVSFGGPGDVPVAGDWDADGSDDVGLVRGNTWYLDIDLSGGYDERRFRFGSSSDLPVVGDWNGDGYDTAGVVRGNDWYLENERDSDGNADIAFAFGADTDRPVVGRWTPDATHDGPGVVRRNTWYLKHELTNGYADKRFRYGSARDRKLTWGESGTGTVSPDAPQVIYRFTVGKEGNPNGDLGTFRAVALEALNDARSWSLDHEIRYAVTDDHEAADFHLWLTDDEDVGEKAPVCADTYSCTVGDDLYINDRRWNNTTATWDHRERRDYRRYVVNHEAGHWLGLDHFNGYDCPEQGADAPVMMQQSKFTNGCETNIWPLPFERRRVRDAHIE